MLVLATNGFSQETMLPLDADRYQRLQCARNWFSEAKYKQSYPIFKELEQWVMGQEGVKRELFAEEIRFHLLACELMEDNPAAAEAAEQFMGSNAGSLLKQQLGYYLGGFHFRNNDYPAALAAFEKASVARLNNGQVAEMQFMQGYSYFTQKQFASAKPLFQSVRQTAGSPYRADAHYYFGVIAFSEQRYKEALEAFGEVRNHPTYKEMVPYYSAGINYATGQKDKGIKQAEDALKQGAGEYKLELMQLLGHGYFEKGEYAKALPMLEEYVSKSEKVKREDLFELAFCHYQQKNYAKAIERFKPLASGSDSLSEHAMYLLGDAYLKTGDRPNARNAFMLTSKGEGRSSFREPSVFNYGKLSFELGFDNDALPALKQYLNEYPNGAFATEASDLLIGVLANTSNYKEALELYESSSSQSEVTRRLYPRVAFNRAQQLLNDRKIAEAERLFEKVRQAPYNIEVVPLVHFWQAEIHFAREQFADAVPLYQTYLKQPVNAGDASVANARYGLAYSLMRLSEYSEAAKILTDLQSAGTGNAVLATDVSLRLADCYFMQKEFVKANALYSRIANQRIQGSDYALYQQGIIAGAQRKPDEKVALLGSIERLYPNSNLVGTAYMEMAKTHMAAEKFREALPLLSRLIATTANEGLKPEAYLKMGLAHYNLNNNQEAIEAFQRLAKEYPQSTEAEDAIDNLRSIYIELGQPDAYVAWLKSIGKDVDNEVADSLTYASAELAYSDGKKAQALTAFENYLGKYPSGRYAIEAHFLAAEILMEQKKLKEATGHYAFVADQAPNQYAEQAMVAVSRLYYFEWKDYANSTRYYRQLKNYATRSATRMEAMRGLVRSQFYQKDYAGAGENARELLAQNGAADDDRVFANMVIGKQAIAEVRWNEALSAFQAVAALSKSEMGAEARYEVARSLLALGKLTDAEKAAFDVIQKTGSYTNWVEKSYLLLGDIFYQQKDLFNALATYKSVSENATQADVKKEATEKLKKVETESDNQSKIGGE